jgi:hypothetical protein
VTTLQDLLGLLPDNTSGDISAADMRSVVTELWNRITSEADDQQVINSALSSEIQDLDARIAALETMDGSSNPLVTGRWQINPQAGVVPGGQQMTSETGIPATSGWFRFANFEQGNTDLSSVLLKSTRLMVQQQMNSENWCVVEVVPGSQSINGSYTQVGITGFRGGGSIESAQWQAAVVAIEWSSA